jgi:hypothetical protein
MLKRRIGDEIRLTSQPDHAAVSGYLAAHWGNAQFQRPGHYAPSADAEAIRAETVLAIAEHDNGWWEWEADPPIDRADGVPLHLLALTHESGLDRWRRGVPRFEENHPYVSLLISYHAYWLQAPRCDPDVPTDLLHPLFGSSDEWPLLQGEEFMQASRFVAEQRQVQDQIITRLSGDPFWQAAIQPEMLEPHIRLLQIGDALSLHLSLGAERPIEILNAPRGGRHDRATITVTPVSGNRLVCEPYPIDQDPLRVVFRARVLPATFERPADFQSWWHAIPRRDIRFEYTSA